MKKTIMILAWLMCFMLASGQFRSFGLTTGAGYTAVDIEKAIDWYDLEDWDHIGVIIKAFGEYELKSGFHLVGEIGSNRLYYWEYRWSDGYYSGYRWRSEWTTNVGISVRKLVGEAFFVQAGAGVHVFNDGSGIVPGLLLGLGYDVSLSDHLRVPVGFRVEPVFGSALPTSLLLNAGIRYDL